VSVRLVQRSKQKDRQEKNGLQLEQDTQGEDHSRACSFSIGEPTDCGQRAQGMEHVEMAVEGDLDPPERA
jgi:hypothetical protein